MSAYQEKIYEQLVKAGYEPEQLSKDSADKYFTHVLEKIQKQEAEKISFRQRWRLIFGAHPVLAASFLIFFLLLLGTCGLLTINMLSGKVEITPSLIVISPSAVSVPINEQLNTSRNSSGYELKPGDTISTRQAQFIRLQADEHWFISLLPETELSFSYFDHHTNKLHLKLTRGAIYLKTTQSTSHQPSVAIQINKLVFSCERPIAHPQTATIPEQPEARAYFAVTGTELAKVVCYAGNLKIRSRDGAPISVENPGLNSEVQGPVSLDFHAGSFQKHDTPEKWDELVNTLDQYLSQEQIISNHGLGIIKRLHKSEKPVTDELLNKTLTAADAAKLKRTELLTRQLESLLPKTSTTMLTDPADKNSTTKSEQTHPATYRVERVGKFTNIKAENPEQTGDINFFSGLTGKNFICLVSRKACFLLKDSQLIGIQGLPVNQTYTSRPLLAGDYILVSSLDTLYQIDPVTAQVKKSIPLPDNGINSDNYSPCYPDNTLIMPLQNLGYCSLQPTSDTPVWNQFYSEPFPLAPLSVEKSIIVGSYFSHYLARVDMHNNTSWKKTFQGRSFSNPVLKTAPDGPASLLMYSENNHRYTIAQISLENGSVEKEWVLPQAIFTDFIYTRSFIFGVDTDGKLFRINTENAETKEITTAIHQKLTISEWRNVLPLLAGPSLYLGTDTGMLLIYNPETEALTTSILVDPQASFYTQPLILKNTVYLISDAGVIYGITI